jgi:hypothetical protein
MFLCSLSGQNYLQSDLGLNLILGQYQGGQTI